MKSLTESIGKFFLWLIVATVQVLIGGFVFMKLWGWFVVPIFDVTLLTLGQSIGLSFFIGYIKMKKDDLKNDNNDDKTWGEKLFVDLMTGILIALFILGIGWIFSLYM